MGWIGVGIAVLGLLIWGFFSLGIRAPRVYVVHLETPGGPVPLKITFFDKDFGIIRVGHGSDWDTGPMLGGVNGDFQISELVGQRPISRLSSHEHRQRWRCIRMGMNLPTGS